jgi:hypothetical protein
MTSPPEKPFDPDENTREFLDILHQHWARTSGAEKCFWMPEEGAVVADVEWDLYAVDENQEKKHLGLFWNEADADFITAVHGALPDLIRRLHIAIDEADRLDEEKDGVMREYADLALENQGLRSQIVELERGEQ